MNTSILGDKIILLWLVLPAGGAVVFSATIIPWLMGRKWRKKGEQPPNLACRVVACAALAMFSFLAIPIALGLEESYHFAKFACVNWPWPLIVVGCFMVAVLFLGGWGSRVKAHVILLVLVCSISGTVGFVQTISHMRMVLTLREMDMSNLNWIGKGLLWYHYEHGAYPDDLRRLVDDDLFPAEMLLSVRGTDSGKIPETYPAGYPGPCDFIYIRLPEDAPDDCVWVWQPLEHHDGDGGGALFKNGDVEWLEAERLRAEVAGTHKWLETRPTTQPATAPGT